jgi:hypothetical protein
MNLPDGPILQIEGLQQCFTRRSWHPAESMTWQQRGPCRHYIFRSRLWCGCGAAVVMVVRLTSIQAYNSKHILIQG